MGKELTIDLPLPAYEQLVQLATTQRRAVGEVASELILAELPGVPALPQDVEHELAAFSQLSNEVLLLLSTSTLGEDELAELAHLNELAQRGALEPASTARQQMLVEAYERTLVRRAQAALVLRRRGQSYLLTRPAAA